MSTEMNKELDGRAHEVAKALEKEERLAREAGMVPILYANYRARRYMEARAETRRALSAYKQAQQRAQAEATA